VVEDDAHDVPLKIGAHVNAISRVAALEAMLGRPLRALRSAESLGVQVELTRLG